MLSVRSVTVLFLLFICISMVWACIGCRRSFDTCKGLGIHHKSCRDHAATTRKILLKRKLSREHSIPAKCARKDLSEDVSNRRMDDVGEVRNESSSIPDTGAATSELQDPKPATLHSLTASRETALDTPAVCGVRSGRKLRVPKRFADYLPSSATPLSHLPKPLPAQRGRRPAAPAADPVLLQTELPFSDPALPATPESQGFETQPNAMGLYRVYRQMPTLDPDDAVDLADVCDTPALQGPESEKDQPDITSARPAPNLFSPFPNVTISRLMRWWYGGSGTKSAADLDRLVKDVIQQDDFNASHLKGFSAARECSRLDADGDKEQLPFKSSSGWSEHSVKIRLPAEYQTCNSERDAPEFEISGVHVRKLVNVVRDAFQDPTALTYHMTPFKQFWKPSEDAEAQRVFSELYSSDAMLEEYEKVCSAPSQAECNLERTVAAIMLWSDSTHLANFGTSSLWPIYAYFGNQSKYTRAKPTTFASHHLAYIPALPDNFEDFYTSIFGGSPTSAVRTHCKRELMHAIWELLLDPEFMHAYEHGIVIVCADGVSRRIFPRFFTYSADYPEKVLLATIKYLAQCPCPRCLIEMNQISDMGSKNDMHRRENIRFDSENRQLDVELTRTWIFEKGYLVDGSQVKAKLGPISAIPTRNAFSLRLFAFGFNFFSMFVPDLLHEFELGVWKNLFTHLIRILYAIGNDVVQRLNSRYRQIPTFGRDTIRRFSTNVSEMKKFAGRDFEDLLQCALPAFEGLLPPPHDALIADLLFTLAAWHAGAKLRLHTEATLEHFEVTTTTLGRILRKFVQTTCNAYVTQELPREFAARSRRRAAASSKANTGKAPAAAKPSNSGGQTASSVKRKLFNLSTYKLHALADYAKNIRLFGTSDSYSTQVGELEHRRVKRFFARTNKAAFTRQIAKHERRERKLQKIASHYAIGKIKKQHAPNSALSGIAQVQRRVSLDLTDSEPLPYTNPTARYHMSQSTKFHMNITQWLGENKHDPAFRDFLPRLQDHILARLLDIPYDGDDYHFSDADRSKITFVNNRIYRHKVLRVNYTTYNVRRAQDSLNPRTHADFMCLSRDDQDQSDSHPFWYGRIIGVFHALVRHIGPRSKSTEIQKIDFLWVRWFGLDPNSHGGYTRKRLHRIGFLESDNDSAFGFLDPAEIVRAVHLIPAFAHGKTTEILGRSIVRPTCENNEDWCFFYVNPFVDRDMFMRFLGGGVGHKATPTETSMTDSSNLPAEDTADSIMITENQHRDEDLTEQASDLQVVDAGAYLSGEDEDADDSGDDSASDSECDLIDLEGEGDDVNLLASEGYDEL